MKRKGQKKFKMFAAKIFLVVLIPLIKVSATDTENESPSVLISALVRNKEYSLPYFLSSLYNLNYPKSRLTLFFQSDNNADDSVQILRKWVRAHSPEYHSVNLSAIETGSTVSKPTEWNANRYEHVIKLRENALNSARSKTDYILMIDADAFLVEPNVLTHLIEKKLPVVAPMLKSEDVYSNFWCGMSQSYYYNRTDDYKPILYRDKDKVGCHKVPMVHTAVLIDLKADLSEKLTYDPKNMVDYNGPTDDIISFAISATKNNIPMYICNDFNYGYVMVPLDDDETLVLDKRRLLNIKLEAIADDSPLPLNKDLEEYVSFPAPQTFGFDKIFMINLKRRQQRYNLMMQAFKEMGMEVTVFDAVDGKTITQHWLKSNNIHLMPEYEDVYHLRPIKMGEIGCALSHYYIWLDIVRNKYQTTLVLEDDLRFEPYFTDKLYEFKKELLSVEWDFVYLGRKILNSSAETYVTNNLVKPGYSYWTIAYALTLEGAKKLVDAKPLNNLIPVDEFIPLMFGQNPNDTWSKYFPRQNLIALAAAPLLIHPTHYTNTPGYISDTEDSDVFYHPHTEL